MAAANSKTPISDKTKEEAMKVAKATQKPGQTKEQTKLIAQGIEKGIAEYKKQHKSKAREKDKIRKQERKAKQREQTQLEPAHSEPPQGLVTTLPWILLALSWSAFILFYLFNH